MMLFVMGDNARFQAITKPEMPIDPVPQGTDMREIMMDDMLFEGIGADLEDVEIAKTVGIVLDADLPEECTAGIAANVHILQSHIDILQKGAL